MNKKLFNLLSAVLLMAAVFTMFPVPADAADTTTSSNKKVTCKQTEQMRSEWKAIYAYRIDSDIIGGAGDVLLYILLHDQGDKDAFYQKMLSFHRIMRQYGNLAKIDLYGEDKAAKAYFRLYGAQEIFEQIALALVDGTSRNSAVPPQKLAHIERAIDNYEKISKVMKDTLLAGITPEIIKKDPELHAMLSLAEMMVTALDVIQESYACILMKNRGEGDRFFAKITTLDAVAGRFKGLASVGLKGKEKRTELYADVLKARGDLASSAKNMFASYKKNGIPPTTEITAFKKDASRFVSLVEELINLMGGEGVRPCD
ncbi:MAG: hypothetical protein NT178_07215 [Proteobacteria bacterium]|nr:hypothetical protein [Pseudomonadota bacterium]